MWRGSNCSFGKAKFSFACQKRTRKAPATFEAREATGCGSQRLLRYRSHPAGRCPNSSSLYPPQAAVVAVALFSRFSHLLLRSRLYALAERKVLRKRNTIGGAVNRRSTKNAFSEAASFFPFRHLLRDYQGRAALDSCLPRLESSGCFSGSLLARKRELSLTEKAIQSAPPARAPT